MKLFTEPDPRVAKDCGIVAFCVLAAARASITINYNAVVDLFENERIWTPKSGCKVRPLAKLMREALEINNYYRESFTGLTLEQFALKNKKFSGLVVTFDEDDERAHAQAMVHGVAYNAQYDREVIGRMAVPISSCISFRTR
jgi:hypothetical protein